MPRLSLASSEIDDGILGEECIRDQLSAAEELVYVGHKEPALVAAGAALEGALRFGAGRIAGPTASAGALLEALLAMGAIDDYEYEVLIDALAARDRLVHGYAPEHAEATAPDRIWVTLHVATRLLEPPAAWRAGARRP